MEKRDFLFGMVIAVEDGSTDRQRLCGVVWQRNKQ
jgi:hypothetical protein